MDSNQSNLLSFLTKQALFNNSPSKNFRRKSSRSRSKDRSQEISSTNSNHWGEDNTNTKSILNQLSGQKVQNSPIKPTYSQLYPPQPQEPAMQNSLWSEITKYPTSFQAARVQALTILQKLSDRLKGEVKNINVKLESFNSEMEKVITGEFKNFRERLLKIMEDVFKDSQRYIREYMKTQEEKLAKDMILMRDFMQNQYNNIEKMKVQIHKPTWRKPTGQIIGSQLEQKVNDIINKSHQLYIGKWDSGEIMGYRVKDFEKNLTDILKLKK